MSNNQGVNRNISERDLKKILKNTNRTEEQKEIKKFLVILFCVVVIVLGFYFFTKDVVEKDKKDNKKASVTFNYDQIILGELFNRPYDEYYVIAFNRKDPKSNYYYSFFSRYKSKEEASKIYIADLEDSMNSKFYSKESSNPKSSSLEDLKLSDLTLLKIKGKKITKFVEKEEDIIKELGL